MARYFAIPQQADGTDRMGTDGVLAGEYQSLDNFKRFNRRHTKPNTTYNLYLKTSNDWIQRGEWNGS